MNRKPTKKQIDFAMKFVECGNASESYVFAYDVTTTNKNTINVKAQELKNHPVIVKLIEGFQAEHRERHNVTVDTLTQELDKAREIAETMMDVKAMISATMGKAKIHGLDKQILEHKGDVSNMQPVINLSMGGKKED